MTSDEQAEAVVEALAEIWFTCDCGHKYSHETLRPKASSFTRWVAGASIECRQQYQRHAGISGINCECGAQWSLLENGWSRKRARP